jgi:hypothetical protein
MPKLKLTLCGLCEAGSYLRIFAPPLCPDTLVLHHWTYSALMPVVPKLGMGLFPLLQWMLILLLGFFYTKHKSRAVLAVR